MALTYLLAALADQGGGAGLAPRCDGLSFFSGSHLRSATAHPPLILSAPWRMDHYARR